MELPENNDPNVKRVLVGIPLKGHTPPESYHDRMMMAYYMGGTETEQKHKLMSPRYEFIWVSLGEIFIPFAREMLAEKALEYKADYLFMVDDDMMAPVDLFYKLVRHDVDIVSPLAFTRNPPHHPVMFILREGYDEAVKQPYYKNEAVNNYPRNKLVECDAVGFGAVLIKTDIFKKLSKMYFMGTPGAGEDIHFCWKARKAGFRVFMDTSVKLGHISHPVIVTEEYADTFRKMSEVEREKFYGQYHKYPTMDILK